MFVVEQLMASISRIERQLNKRIATLEEENQAASDFLTNVSHEIRTPVNVIVGMSQLAIEDEPEQTQKERLSDIFDAGNRVSEQISDIMDYSEIDMNRIAVNEEDYMISSVVTDEAAIISRQMKKGVEVIMDVDPTLPAVMHSDVAKIKKILFHLISNGIKFTNEGGVYIKIGYEKQAYGINLIITVTDTGIGMEMEDERAIFRRFYQGDSRRTRSSGGLGLGLPIVVGFLRALGGFIYIDSTPQGGTTIRASIPQKVVDEGPCADIRDKNNVCIGAFFYFGKISNPQVREFYNSLLDNLATMTQTISHRADNIDNLKRLVRTVRFTHLHGLSGTADEPDDSHCDRGRRACLKAADKGPRGSQAGQLHFHHQCHQSHCPGEERSRRAEAIWREGSGRGRRADEPDRCQRDTGALRDGGRDGGIRLRGGRSLRKRGF